MAKEANIVILGAGVTGITTALQLLRAGYKNITVVAKCLPSTYDEYKADAEYTSPWAGASWEPISRGGSVQAEWDEATWRELWRLIEGEPEAGVWLQKKTAYYRDQDRKQDQFNDWFKHIVPDYRFLSASEVPPFADWGVEYKTISLHPNTYLNYMQSTCISKGVKFRQQTVSHIREAFFLHSATSQKADVVVNCCGVRVATLGGVLDEAVKPKRGQLVIVENKSDGIFCLSGRSDDGVEEIGESAYIINRPGVDGTALGGCSHTSWSQEPDPDLAVRIMKRAIMICPNLVPPGSGIEALRVVRHQVGFRPFREGGPRIERDVIHDEKEGVLNIVHSYGAHSYGFQASYGMANLVVKLVGELFDEKE